MGVKVSGVVVVPIEGRLVNALLTLASEDRLARYEYLDTDPNRVVVDPDSPDLDRELRLFVHDTKTGRKVVASWSDKTVPIIDCNALDEDIDVYTQMLFDSSEKLAARVSKRKSSMNRWQYDARVIQAWIQLIDIAKDYRNALLKRDSRLSTPKGLGVRDPKFSFFDGAKKIKVVGDAYYYEDIKICRTDTSVEKVREYAESCSLQATLAKAKYLVTGEKSDFDYYVEKTLKAKIDNSLIFLLVKKTTGPFQERRSRQLLADLAYYYQTDEESVYDLWRVACKKYYLGTSDYSPPDKLDDILGLDYSPFDVFLIKFGNKIYGDQRSKLFKSIKYEAGRSEDFVFVSNRLSRYLPVEKAKTRESGEFYYREKKSARLHYRTQPQGV